MRWSREFLVRIIADGGLKSTHEDRKTIAEKLPQLAESGAELSLSRVAHVLPTHLHAALQEWLGEGPFGFFDSTENDLQLSNWTCIEMKRFMSIDRMARAFMDHAFRVFSGRLGAKPTFIYIEEASFLLNNPLFLSALDDWLKTFRRLNAFGWLAMQSPESVLGIADERIRATLADNIANIILGFNQRLENHRDLYKRMFALTDEQVNLIGIRSLRRLQNQDSMRKCSRRTMPTNCTIVCCCRQLENANCKRFLARLQSPNTIGLPICVWSGTRFGDLSGFPLPESVLNCSCGASALAKRRNSTKP